MGLIEAYDPSFLSARDADDLYEWLSCDSNVIWQRETFQIFGRNQVVPRLTAWFGDEGIGYRYTGLDHEGKGWPDSLSVIRDRVCTRLNHAFNFAILNRYRSGSDHMGWHRDAEKGTNPQIASLSLGAVRTFRIKSEHGSDPESLDLAHGSLLAFDGFRRHQLPKRKTQTSERINITFRYIGTMDELSNTEHT
ncbi:MAG: alpha-ketoglutarate-dependent dioxygenase AlkB [Pseudomonadales bacterium]|nr:alpha-ketoglutarate-dependent dioxygenase AlkB [Pseudomonadales bacterium]